jgi:hypothetical protein
MFPAIYAMNKFKFLFPFLPLLITSLVNGQNISVQIPHEIKQFGDSVILATIGGDFFERTNFLCDQSMIALDQGYLTINDCNSTKKEKNRKKNQQNIEPRYFVLKYNLCLIDSCNYEFEVRIGKDLDLLKKVQLPNCANSDLCNIKIDKAEAIHLAIKSGLQKGFGIYNDGLTFDEDTGTFQWRIQNHSEKELDRGELIYIDAITGERISKKDSQWRRSIVN